MAELERVPRNYITMYGLVRKNSKELYNNVWSSKKEVKKTI